jgi:hypothetical protein
LAAVSCAAGAAGAVEKIDEDDDGVIDSGNMLDTDEQPPVANANSKATAVAPAVRWREIPVTRIANNTPLDPGPPL